MATIALREHALSLPERERAELARDLIRSLDVEADADTARRWAQELERLARSVVDRTAEIVDGNEVFARARARLLGRQK